MNPSQNQESNRSKDHYRSYHYDRDRERDRDRDRDRHHYDDGYQRKYYERDHKYDKKKLYSYILLPKNYFNYIEKNFSSLSNDLHEEIDDIGDIQYDYTLPYFAEHILRLSTSKTSSKALAIKIISEYLFHEMKDTYKNMTYLKVSILIPNNVIGFIIGIDGKNINTIRDETGARIEVFAQNNSRDYRQIEIAGSPGSISRAAEKIYSITNRYINFDNSKILGRGDYPSRDSYYDRKHGDHDFEYRKRYSISRSRSRSSDRDRDYKRSMQKRQTRKSSNASDERRGKYYKDREMRMKSSSSLHNESSSYKYTSSKNLGQNSKTEHKKREQSSNKSEKKNDTINNEKPQPNPSEHIDFSNFKQNSNDEGQTCSLDLLLSSEKIDILKNYQNNIWIELENKYHCNISKKTEKIDGKEVSIITFTGKPDENSFALFHLQTILNKNFK